MSNDLPTRDLWLAHATDALRPLFQDHGLPLSADIRFAIAFTSTGRKGKRVGETWHSEAIRRSAVRNLHSCGPSRSRC